MNNKKTPRQSELEELLEKELSVIYSSSSNKSQIQEHLAIYTQLDKEYKELSGRYYIEHKVFP